jgi:hypothetical protein
MRKHTLIPSALVAVIAACGSTPDAPAPLGAPEDFYDKNNASCVLECAADCADVKHPWICPSLGPWAAIPHAAACGDFDGASFPVAVQGRCRATEPSGSALAKAQVVARPIVLPDGRRLAPAGRELLFQSDGGFPSSMLRIAGTRFIAVSDYGYEMHSLRVIDTALLESGGKAEVARITYPPPASLDYGLAYVPATKLLYASSGSHESAIFAYDFDESTGALSKRGDKTIKLPAGSFPSGLDASPDGKTLVVAQAASSSVLVVSVDAANYGAVTATLDAGSKDVFSLHFDPADPTGNTLYATCWTGQVLTSDASKMRLVRLDLNTKSVSALAVGQQPEEVAFIDDRWMVVANALGDTLSLIDRPANKVAAEIATTAMHGPSPTTLAYDAASKRLYVTLAQQNAVGVFSVDTTTPAITPIGTFPTAWWPTAISVDPADGTVFVLSGRGHGIGSDDKQYPVSVADEAKRMAGSIAAVPMMDAAALAAATKVVDAQNNVAAMSGYSTVECAGAPYDFPISQKPEDGPSQQIKHVFFIVRENKTFDGIMGGQPGVDGKADLVLAPGNMDAIWPNAFAIASQFAQMDNYYINAEQSIQGHAWTVFGRTTDYAERRWVNIWGRGEWGATSSPGVGGDTTPAEGNIFEFLSRSKVSLDNQGEFIGGLAIRDAQWPGGSTSGAQPDTVGACYQAWRLRVMCDPKQFTYSWLVNDHTFGFEAGRPNPAVMIATNDEATGMYVDALSHSPFWKDSLIIVVEDDPSQGGDHVDVHRTIALFASPWIKRRYVSHAHYDLASVHKLISDIYGLPYRNTVLANAPLPLDIFTSTPDYAPFDYVPRQYTDASCNPGGTSGAKAAEGWDFSSPDNQPGLSAQVWQALHALPAASR